MASGSYDANNSYDGQAADAARDDDAPRARSVGEHIFIWIAWALAAAFWGASLTTLAGIVQAMGQTSWTISGSGYLVLVVMAFALMAAALAYGSLRSASRSRSRG